MYRIVRIYKEKEKSMWELSINGVDFYHIANWFYIYSFLGWLWETCYVSVRKGKLINRGFINGPLCTIYGCGALAVYLILLPVSGDLLLLFVGGVVVANGFGICDSSSDGEYFPYVQGGTTVIRSLIFRDVSAWDVPLDGAYLQ